MTDPFAFDSAQRWLVVAPHPDDEVLGTGGLLQRAVGAGGRATVALLTDGGNNPWPQRFIERRIALDHEARERWGARRRAEAEAALGVLGLDPSDALVPLGWPDGEIDRRFASSPQALVGELADVLDVVQPTHLVLPSADDTHPDHNTAAVIGVLAARRLSYRPRILSFRVHGPGTPPPLVVPLDAEQLARKARALEEHRTQLALSRRRFSRRARGPEAYFDDPFASGAGRLRAVAEGKSTRLTLARVRAADARAGRVQLRVAYVDRDEVVHTHTIGLGAQSGLARYDAASETVSAVLPFAGAREVLAKLERKQRGIWIYDREGWCRAPSS